MYLYYVWCGYVYILAVNANFITREKVKFCTDLNQYKQSHNFNFSLPFCFFSQLAKSFIKATSLLASLLFTLQSSDAS